MALRLWPGKASQIAGADLPEAFERPMLVQIATLDASKKAEALAYARGLADAIVEAKDVCYLHVEDLGGERWLCEIHEGGAGRSIASWVRSELDQHERVMVPLAAGRTAIVTSHDGHVVTLLVPEGGEVGDGECATPVGDSKVTMQHFYGPARLQRSIALTAFCVSSVVLCFAGVLSVLRSNAIDPVRLYDRYATSTEIRRTDLKNLPSIQLAQAAKGLDPQAGYLTYLRFKDGKWTWAQASASAGNAFPPVPLPRPDLAPLPALVQKGARK